MKQTINIGLIGFGNIGSGVVKTLNKNLQIINSHLKTPLYLSKIADIDIATKRDAEYDPAILSNNADDIINDPNIDIVIELIGGIEPAKTFIEKSLKNCKHVVTANKALLSQYGAELMRLAYENNVGLFFEASVGGGIPIIHTLQRSLLANTIISIYGIVNGTSNYILSKMTEEGKDFGAVLKEAQKKGLAEPDPTFDIEGIDSGHKVAILASLAFKQDIRFSDVYVEGISRIKKIDILFAKEFGYVIKLLVTARRNLENNSVEVLVAPTLVPENSMLGSVSEAYNAILVEGDVVGKLMFYGKGAGPEPTSSAVLNDVINISEHLNAEGKFIMHNNPQIPIGFKNIKPVSKMEALYYIRLSALDQPGTMAKISNVLSDFNISINSLIQKGEHEPHKSVPLIIITHKALESDVQKALHKIASLDVVADKPFVLRVME